jgi:hypothetical protein
MEEWDSRDREEHPLANNLPAMFLAAIMLAVYAALANGAFLLLRIPLRFLARFILELTS